jgi:3-oxoacyl-[acyl-carrier protein] reductase
MDRPVDAEGQAGCRSSSIAVQQKEKDMAGRLQGKGAIITGATRGIGKGIARVFVAEGARVLIVGRDEEAGNRTAGELRQAGGEVAFCRADVSRRADADRMAQEAVDLFGRLDILVSNAGIFPSTKIEDMTEADWDHVQAVNLKGTFLAVQACFARMKGRGWGRIVLTSSITGPVTGFPGWAHYGATKAGMLGFMRTAALEFARHGVTVNAVLPGNIRTEGLAGLGEEYVRRMERSIPLGVLGEPEDVGQAALFLASDEARFITGQTLVVDGGQTLPESLDALPDH